jgi:hypothetical protein
MDSVSSGAAFSNIFKKSGVPLLAAVMDPSIVPLMMKLEALSMHPWYALPRDDAFVTSEGTSVVEPVEAA